MARISISLPQSAPLFNCSIAVRIGDVNYGNHVGNDNFVSIIHEARVQFLKHYCLSELAVSGSVGLIMSGLSVQFIKESFYGDQLDILIYSDAISNVSFDLIYDIQREAVSIVRATTTMVCYDYDVKKVKAIPELFVKLLQGDDDI